MAFYSKMRVPQLTGSYGITDGKINDQGAAIATGSISSGGLDEILGHLASSIKRIHGSSSFSEAPAGTFYHSLVPGAADSAALGSAAAEWSDLFLADSAVINLGADQDVTITHVPDDGVIINTDKEIQFRASTQGIKSGQANRLNLFAGQDIYLDASGMVRVANDLQLDSDAAIIQFGDDQEVTLTHVHGDGLLLNSAMQLQFGDSGTYVHQSTNGQLDAIADVKAMITAPVAEIQASTSIQLDSPIIDFEDDGVVLQFGDDDDVLLTHVHNSGLLLGSGDKLMFGDAGESVSGDGTDMAIASSNDIGVIAGNKMTIDAQGTDSGDGVEITLGADDANVKFVVQNNSAADALVVDGLLDVTVGRNLTVVGNLDVNGTTTTVDTTNLTIEDSIIALGVSGSGGYSASGDRGIIFPRGATGSKTAGFFFNGTDFNLGMSLTGPTSGSFASIANAEYSSLKAGTLKAGADSSYDLGEDGTAYRKLYVDDIDLNGVGRIDFDADADTSIRSSTDDVLVFEAGAADVMTLTAQGLQIADDKGLVFGTNNDVVVQYDEDGNDVLEITGANWRYADDIQLQFGTGGDASIEYDENGDDVLQIAGANVRIGHGAATQLQFRDSDVYLNSDADGVLNARADSQITLAIGGTDELIIASAASTFGGHIAIPDAGQIGNASVADIMTLAADGVVTFKDDLVTKDSGTFGNATNPDLLTLAAAAVTVKSNSDFNVAKTAGLQLGGVAVSSTAAEINKLDAGTAGSSLALADADAFIVGDATASNETKKALLSDVVTYIQAQLTQKVEVLVSGPVSPNADVDLGFTADADWTNAPAAQRELYLNGQLLVEGGDASANKDFYPGGSAGRVKFEFALAQGDVIQAILRAG